MADTSKKTSTARPAKAAKTPAPKKTKGLTAHVYDLKGSEKGTVALPETLFKVMASPKLLAQYVRVYLSNQHQGTHSAKTRSEVTGSTRKIWRQKGTGRARHSSRKANLFVGGGVTFGPQPRSHALKMTKKQRQKALYNSLSLKAANNKVKVLDGVASLTGKTKEVKDIFAGLGTEQRKTLVVYAPDQADTFKKAMGNIQGVQTSQDRLLNAFLVLKADTVVFTQEALKDFVEFRKA